MTKLTPTFNIYRANILFKPKIVVNKFIIRTIEDITQTRFEFFLNNSRKTELVFGRQLYYYLMKMFTKETLYRIGAINHNGFELVRDHSTVIHGIETIQNMIDIPSNVNHQDVMEAVRRVREYTNMKYYGN